MPEGLLPYAGDRMLYWISLLLVLAVLLREKRTLEKRRMSIPLRIHVHGTRGKSSTVRILAEELKKRGFRVLAKTTGDSPEYILPDGTAAPIRRFGPARIAEHIRIFRKAEEVKADALVVEGMALQPETVWQSQNILQATHAVITNVRPDHSETMGEGMEGPSSVLALMAVPGRPLFTGDEAGKDLLARHIARTASPLPHITPVSSRHFLDQPRDLARAAALAAAAERGLPALPETQEEAQEDRPTLRPQRLLRDPAVSFLDLFSANDVASTRMLCAVGDWPDGIRKIALLSTRADRPLRTKAFLDWLAESDFHTVIPMGSHAPFALFYGRRLGLRMFPLWPFLSPEKTFGAISLAVHRSSHKEFLIVGMGNTHGFGETWRAFCRRIGER